MAANQLLALPIGDPSDTNQLAPQPTLADAYDYNTQALGDWIRQQRAQSVAMGYLDPNTGLPTQAGLVNAAHQFGNALLMGSVAPEASGIRAFHGSPYDFDQFSSSNIGTGEGAQAYGHGLYFAGNPEVAQTYKTSPNQRSMGPAVEWVKRAGGDWGKALSMFKDFIGDKPETVAQQEVLSDLAKGNSPGHMYEVNIAANPDQLLDWDKPLSEQSEAVKQKLIAMNWPHTEGGREITVGQGYNLLDPVQTADILRQAGIPGIKYLDAGSRGEGQGTHNYVVFNDNLINILRKYGIAGLMGGGAAAAAGTQDQQ